MNRVLKIANHLQEEKSEQNLVAKPTSMPWGKLLKPMKVLVTGAAGNIAYSVLFGIARGMLLGSRQPIDIVLLDIKPMATEMKGVVMELHDCAFPLLNSITSTVDYEVAFKDVEVALLIGARPRGKGMVRSDLLKANAKIFEGQGKALDQWADKNCKIVVVGNPANTNCLIAQKNAPSIPAENFTAMTRLDQNRSMWQIAQRLKVQVQNVKNITIWGNHSKTQYPDVNHAYVSNYPRDNEKTPVRIAVDNDEWLNGDFIHTVQHRGAEVIESRGLSSAASAANACMDHVRSWLLGTKEGEWVSMGVVSDGSYEVPKGIVYSFPVTCSGGNWKIVEGLKIDDFSLQKMRATCSELLAERRDAFAGPQWN